MVSNDILELDGPDKGWFSRTTNTYLPRNSSRDRRAKLLEIACETLIEATVHSWPSKQAAEVSISIHVTPKKKTPDADRGDDGEGVD